MTGFTADKKLIWTKNKFETFLNSEESIQFWLNTKSIVSIVVDVNKHGTHLRKKDKVEFSRLYLMWVNTK